MDAIYLLSKRINQHRNLCYFICMGDEEKSLSMTKTNIQKLLHKIEHMAEKLKFGVYLEARQPSHFFTQTSFAAFGKGMQFVSRSPYAESE